MDANQARERATHPKPTVLSDFILGSQDGIVNVLGIILGLSAATRDVRIILVATLAALGAESIAMGAVAYTSTRARRRLYLSQAVQERREMKEIPQTERDEVREILTGWGYQGADLEEIVERICRNPTAELEFMMSFELKLSPVEASAPRASAFLVGTATVVGHFIPLSPFLFVGLPELLALVQTVAIIVAIVIAVYFSRRQIEALATDTEARVVNDLDEKLHRMGEIFMEKPEFVRILNDNAAVSNFGAEVAFAFYVMFFCSHCYHMRQRGILNDNDWAGWLQWTKNAFRSGRLGKYWKEAEMQAWVDPAFREFVNQEILVGT